MDIKKIMSHRNLLGLVGIIAVIAAGFSCMTYGRAFINNDMATASLLVRCEMLKGQFFPSTWKYAHSDLWVLALNAFTMPFVAVCKDQTLARQLGSLMVILLMVVGAGVQSRKLFKDYSFWLAIPVCLLFLPGTNQWILWEASYTIALLYMVFITTYGYVACKQRDVKDVIISSVLIALACMTGTRYLAELILPMCAGLFFSMYFSCQGREIKKCFLDIKELALELITIIVPSVVGLVAYKIVVSHTLINSAEGTNMTLSISLTDCWTDFTNWVIELFLIYGFNGGSKLLSLPGITSMVGIVFCVLTFAVLPIQQWKCIKEEANEVQYFFYYGLIHNIIMFLMFIFMGYNEPRYILSSIFINIVISARYVLAHIMCEKDIRRYVWTICFMIAVTLQVVSTVKLSRGWKDILNTRKEFAKILVENGTKKGYANTLYSGPLEVYSDFELEMGQVYFNPDGISSMEWLIDVDRFNDSGEPSFIILSQAEYDVFAPNMEQLLGYPIYNYTLTDYTGTEFYIFVYDYDVISTYH